MIGILCVQLGTPDSPFPKDVKRYLTEFLTDPMVIDSPWPLRQLLVRGLIVPTKFKDSSENYQMIWQKGGSPLKIYTEKLVQNLGKYLGPDFKVLYAMRYQNPSIASQLKELLKHRLKELVIVPLFPQYAMATTGSIIAKVFDLLKDYKEVPSIRVISSFEDHPSYIEALKETVSGYSLDNYDQVIISFHSLPVKQAGLYPDACFRTAKALVKKLELSEEHYTISFQSKLGRAAWVGPSTSETLERNWKKVLLISPSFVADCIETLHELAIEEKHTFIEKGGELFDLTPCLNDSPRWIRSLAEIINK
jgi:ferrochelatase